MYLHAAMFFFRMSSFLLGSFIFLFVISVDLAKGQNGTYVTPSDAIPQLTNLTKDPVAKQPLTLGGQSFSHCCLLAVNTSVAIVNGSLVKSGGNSSFIEDDLENFLRRPFPCDASYNGNNAGTSVVSITYGWCKSNCRGWSLSKTSTLNEWVGPFVGFLIPAVVFCLAIPRRRKLHIGDWFFNVSPNQISSSPRTPFIIVLAALLITADTIVWLMTVFALSGPILLSGIYEAYMDSRILTYMQTKIDNHRLSTEQRAHLLYTVLVGNLDLSGVPKGDSPDNTTWKHVCGLTVKLSLDYGNEHFTKKTKTRLRTMLASQYSFGSTVGAPVVFFCGTFLYTLIDNLSNLGSNDISHALAFGMWWMTIPHISIVSALLLAGNNPNTLEGVVGHETCAPQPPYLRIFVLVYESRYKPAWIWFRGRSKKLWIERMCRDSSTAPENLANGLEMTGGDWIVITTYAYALIIIPSCLAFLTSFYTPKIGLSCRSMTFLLYMLSQFWLIIMWIWDLCCSHNDDNGNLQTPATHHWQKYIWYTLTVLGGFGAIFSAIGGTMMQIMGVYRNCLCSTPMTEWYSDDARFNIGVYSAEDIDKASTWWKGTSAGAVAFLAMICYIGWWYQRRLRSRFRFLVDRIDENAQDLKVL